MPFTYLQSSGEYMIGQKNFIKKLISLQLFTSPRCQRSLGHELLIKQYDVLIVLCLTQSKGKLVLEHLPLTQLTFHSVYAILRLHTTYKTVISQPFSSCMFLQWQVAALSQVQQDACLAMLGFGAAESNRHLPQYLP
jgi:hypothetical protein